MATHDKLPMLLPFPAGNWVDPATEQRAEQWLSSVENQDHDRFFERIKVYSRPTPITSGIGRTTYQTHVAALKLCEQWDVTTGDDRRLATHGYEVATAFTREVRYLPSWSLDFTDDLKEMQKNQKDLARQFARSAWIGMASYTYVHDTFQRLFQHSVSRFYIATEGDENHFKAGMALPYMFGWASGLAQSTTDQEL